VLYNEEQKHADLQFNFISVFTIQE
jgi:hypothetical protein